MTISQSYSQMGTVEKDNQEGGYNGAAQGFGGSHEDSPDFNRKDEMVFANDDLTVSKSDITTEFEIGAKNDLSLSNNNLAEGAMFLS